MARGRNGRPAIPYSYGFVGVELRGSAGQRLNLAPNQRAQLRFQIESQQRADAPARVPLWHFDEHQSLWTYGGEFEREGLLYTGEVSHFSWWNCDYPGERATIKGRLVGCNGEPLPGGRVPFGQYGATADENGDFEVWVAAGVRFNATVNPFGVPTGAVYGPFPANQLTTLNEPVLAFGFPSVNAVYLERVVGEANDLLLEVVSLSGSEMPNLSLDGGISYTSTSRISLRPTQLPDTIWVKDESGCVIRSRPQRIV